MEGILLINKPNGLTSHDVVKVVRKKLGIKRVGHAGTLDPLATGVLVVLLGRSTKLFDKFVSFDKVYRATMILGTTTTSADVEGRVISKKPYEHLDSRRIQEVFERFTGEMEQLPPMVSAVKVNGKKLYQFARKGIEVKRVPRRILIKSLKIEEINLPEIRFFVECSKGTYIRQLADDIGQALGCGACISQIERLRVGNFDIENSVSLDQFNESHIRDW